MPDYQKSAPVFDPKTVELGKNYLLVGTEAWLIDSYQRQIRDRLKQSGELDVTTIYADEVKAGELGEHLDTFTIFSGAKMVVIKNCEKFLKKELETVAAYFDAPSEIQCLVIITEKTDAKYNAWKKIRSGCEIIACDPPKFAGDIRNWLMAELRRRDKVMSPKAIMEFTGRIELDYFSTANELAKILLLVGDRKQIGEDDVLTSLSGSRAGTQIDFLRALGNRQIKNALEATALMLQTDAEPLQIFFGLYRFFVNLYKIQLLRDRHISDNEILQKHISDIFFSQRKEYLEFSRRYSLKGLEQIFAILLDTDSKLKSSLTDKTLQLELCIVQALNCK
jgi:DNA polymerase III delta subunit